MTVNLSGNIVLEPVIVTGGKRYVNGANRDVLTFVFKEVSLDELDSIFTEENCENITIDINGEEAAHTGYVIRVDITKKNVETEEGTENRVFVSMAQRTQAEEQLVEMQAFYDAVMEEVGV